MTAVNQVGNALTSSTGTGAFVGSVLPTIASPIIDQINASVGVVNLDLRANSSSVNYLQIANAATGDPVAIVTLGNDANVSMQFGCQGTGQYQFYTSATTNQVLYATGTSFQHNSIFNFPATSASQTYTFPDQTGTVILSAGTQSIGNGLTLTTPNIGAATATSINFGGSSLSTYTAKTAFHLAAEFTFATPGDLSVVYSNKACFYSVVGNLVTVNMYVTGTPTYTTASGNAQISGLPFSAAAGQVIFSNCYIACTGYPATTTYPVLVLNGGSATGTIYGAGTAATGGVVAFTIANFPTGVTFEFAINFSYFI